MGDFAIFYRVMLSICAGMVSIWAAVKVIIEIRKLACKSSDDLRDQVNEIADGFEAHGRMLDNDNKRIGEQGESIRLTLRALMQLMTHEIDGNHVDQLRETRDDIQQFLINR